LSQTGTPLLAFSRQEWKLPQKCNAGRLKCHLGPTKEQAKDHAWGVYWQGKRMNGRLPEGNESGLPPSAIFEEIHERGQAIQAIFVFRRGDCERLHRPRRKELHFWLLPNPVSPVKLFLHQNCFTCGIEVHAIARVEMGITTWQPC
jgi:hypothetical protein